MRVFPSESGVQTRISNHLQLLPFRTVVVQTWVQPSSANPAGLQCKPLGIDPQLQGIGSVGSLKACSGTGKFADTKVEGKHKTCKVAPLSAGRTRTIALAQGVGIQFTPLGVKATAEKKGQRRMMSKGWTPLDHRQINRCDTPDRLIRSWSTRRSNRASS